MPRPWPPYSSSIAIPAQPSSQSSFQTPSSKLPGASSIWARTASGLKREAAKLWAVDLISDCSSLNPKFI